MRALAVVAAALAVPALARAEFEGVLVSKMTAPSTTGTGHVWISKDGLRYEAEMELPAQLQAHAGEKTFRMVTIVKASDPYTSYVLDEKRKTYSVYRHDANAGAQDEGRYTVKRTGRDSVAGFSCDKVLVSDSSGQEFDLCLAPGLAADSGWLRALQQSSQRGSGMFKALSDAGVKGFPVRWATRGGSGFGMELVSAERRSVPASTFAVPAGYTKVEHTGMTMSPESAKALQDAMKRQSEAMKNMTPEQRKQMEEAMKRLGGGNP